MGLETKLEFRKGHGEGFSPNTVLPSPRHCSYVEKRNVEGKGNVELKRGSIYQSSIEVGKMKRRGSTEGRRKIQVPCNGGPPFRVIDTLCSSDDESQQERSSVMSYIEEEPCSPDDFFEICLDSCSPENVGVSPIGPQNDGNELQIHSSLRATSKTRFSPIRKMLDPFMKSKPTRSPLRNKTLQKSLLDDFSKARDLEVNNLVTDSPVHLHGSLRVKSKDSMPYFEFSLKCPEEVLVAKASKSDKASNRVYTFHSIDGRKRSNGSPCSMLGQMQVSSSLCPEMRDGRVFNDSMAMEFVLYDLARGRKSSAVQDPSNCSSDRAKVNPQPKQALGNRELDSPYPCPWAQSDLNPNLEIAATVIEIPFGKRESSKLTKTVPKVTVVIPSGNHSLPSDESQGPSSLLQRWRFGGGCDCSGWDMACPLTVLDDQNLQCGEDHELFVQGSKENVPALTLRFIEEGEYKVDFHAQLSTLQAFSICVAILHSSTEASIAVGKETTGNSLKMLIKEEVKFLVESVMKEEKRKVIKAPFVINPLFSPLSRV